MDWQSIRFCPMILGTAAVITLGKGWGNALFGVYLLCQVRSSDYIKELPEKHVWESHPSPWKVFPIRGHVLVPLVESLGFLAVFKEQNVCKLSIIRCMPSGVEGNIQNSQLLLETSENLIEVDRCFITARKRTICFAVSGKPFLWKLSLSLNCAMLKSF